MKFIYLLLLLISKNSFSYLDCKKRPSITIDLKKDPKGSLNNFKVQDQDGLGTCYANTASVMLEAYYGRPISYHHLAMTSSLTRAQTSIKPDGTLFTEGGLACLAIDDTKEKVGKFCPREYVPIENLPSYGAKQQEVLLKSLGEFYDTYHSLPQIGKQYIKDALLKAKQEVRSQRYNNCTSINKLKQRSEQAIKNTLKYLYLNKLKHSKSLEESNKNEYKTQLSQLEFLGKGQLDNNSRFYVKFTPSIEANISKFIKTMKTKKIKTSEDKENFINSIFSEILPRNFDMNFIKTNNFPFYDDIMRIYFSDIISYIDKKVCEGFDKIKIYNKAFRTCSFQNPKITYIFQDIKFASGQLFGDPDLIDTLISSLQKDLSFDEFYKSIIGNNCESKGLKAPKGLRCKQVKFPMGIDQSLSNILKSEKDKIKKEKETTKKYLNGRVSRELIKKMPTGKRGNPVGVILCTKFFKKQGFDFNWGKPKMTNLECAQGDKHGLHEVSIVGIRCKNGKIHYQIQNSWGKSTNEINNPDIELNQEDGSFWLTEDDLANNIIGMEYLEFNEKENVTTN